MTRYVAFLRAVNLGGDSTLRMSDLAHICQGLGFEGVRTILASGNVTFRAQRGSDPKLERLVEEALTRRVGLRTTVFVRSDAEWAEVIRANPFREEAVRDPAHLLVTLLKDETREEGWTRLREAIVGQESVRGFGRHGYCVYPNGVGRSKLTTALIERHLGTRATSRNWNTVLKVASDLA